MDSNRTGAAWAFFRRTSDFRQRGADSRNHDSLRSDRAPPPAASPSKPNVLFIVVDDLNDWITVLDRSAPIRMPTLERLAARGVAFERAYCASPSCNPSRTTVFNPSRIRSP